MGGAANHNASDSERAQGWGGRGLAAMWPALLAATHMAFEAMAEDGHHGGGCFFVVFGLMYDIMLARLGWLQCFLIRPRT